MKKKLLLFALTAGFFSIANAQTALNFDGTNDYIQTTSQGVLGASNRTFEAWVYVSPTASASNLCISDYGVNASGSRNTFLVTGTRALSFVSGGTNGNISSNANDITPGVWTHVAFVLDSGTGYLYIDGLQVGTGNLSGVNTPTGNEMIKIGNRVTGSNIYFNGSIADFRVWNVARTQTEIQNDMDAQYCSLPTGLVDYYKLNEGAANVDNSIITSINDIVGTTDTGTLNGFTLTGTASNYVTGPNLALNGIDNGATNNNGILTATQTGATYQWVDCDNGNAIISGENAQTFSPTANGNYAVNVTLNGCTVVSNCIQVTTLSSSSFDFDNKITIYPNPVTSIFNLNLGETYESVSVKVINSLGQVVVTQSYSNTNQVLQEIDFGSGVYFVEITTNTGEKAVKRIIKQ